MGQSQNESQHNRGDGPAHAVRRDGEAHGMTSTRLYIDAVVTHAEPRSLKSTRFGGTSYVAIRDLAPGAVDRRDEVRLRLGPCRRMISMKSASSSSST